VLAPREAGFEDGTLNYLSIPAVAIGLRHLERVGIETIQTRIACLTEWLLAELQALQHANGRPVVHLYGPSTSLDRGGTVTMNFHDADGTLLDFRRIEELAAYQGISLRSGCFCNPGAGETAGNLTEDDMRAGLAEGADITLPRFLQVMQQRGGKSLGAIRVSLGIASNFADVDRFLQFAAGFRDRTLAAVGALTIDDANCRVIRDGS
jgi:molybdenum cofactor sulfurtransferase